MGLERISSTKKSTILLKTSIYVKFEHKSCDLSVSQAYHIVRQDGNFCEQLFKVEYLKDIF